MRGPAPGGDFLWRKKKPPVSRGLVGYSSLIPTSRRLMRAPMLGTSSS